MTSRSKPLDMKLGKFPKNIKKTYKNLLSFCQDLIIFSSLLTCLDFCNLGLSGQFHASISQMFEGSSVMTLEINLQPTQSMRCCHHHHHHHRGRRRRHHHHHCRFIRAFLILLPLSSIHDNSIASPSPPWLPSTSSNQLAKEACCVGHIIFK